MTGPVSFSPVISISVVSVAPPALGDSAISVVSSDSVPSPVSVSSNSLNDSRLSSGSSAAPRNLDLRRICRL